jgi:hypothetical protein
MGTTAEKLTYLDGTKTLLKDTINLTGANITNDTFRSYAQKLKLGLINALNVVLIILSCFVLIFCIDHPIFFM